MSLSEGFGVFASSAAADMSWPAWQYPHCGTSSSCQARCSACVPVGDSPSIVMIGALPTADIGVEHDRTALPRMCTVHAPHWPMPQPNLVPFRLRTSLNTHSRGMSPGTSTVVAFPFTVKVNGIALTLRNKGRSRGTSAVLEGLWEGKARGRTPNAQNPIPKGEEGVGGGKLGVFLEVG